MFSNSFQPVSPRRNARDIEIVFDEGEQSTPPFVDFARVLSLPARRGRVLSYINVRNVDYRAGVCVLQDAAERSNHGRPVFSSRRIAGTKERGRSRRTNCRPTDSSK